MLSGPFSIHLRIAIASAATLICHVASASVVFSDGNPNQATTYVADSASVYPAAATAFTTSAISFTGLTWWGGYYNQYNDTSNPSSSDSFQMSIYSDVGGAVGSLITTLNLGGGARTLTGNTISGNQSEYQYSASFSTINLAAGSYFLALSDTDPNSASNTYWGWETASNGQQLGVAINIAGTWNAPQNVGSPADGGLAFQMTSPVPIPGTAWLMLSGLGGLGTMACKRKAA